MPNGRCTACNRLRISPFAARAGNPVSNLGEIQTIGLMVLFASLITLIAQKTRVPHIVVYIVSGLVIAYLPFPLTGLGGLESNGQVVHTISEIGISLLLFLVGLELSLAKIKDVGKVSVIAGLGQVIFTAIFGSLLAYLLGYTITESVVIGTALTFSSTVVVVKILGQKRQLDSLYGRIAVGIFLVQDLVVIFVLTVMAGVFQGGIFEAEGAVWGLAKAFFGMSLLLVVSLIAAKWLLARLLSWAAASTETVFILSLTWCFLLVVTAEAFGLSKEIGSFLAGLGLAQLPLSHALKERIHPLMNFFIAIFFISLGMQMDLSAASDEFLPAIALSLFVLIGNPIIFIWIISKGGFSKRTSFLTSVTVAQISEFSFIFAALCLKTNLIGPSILSVVTLVGLITIVISSYMILYNEKLYEFSKRTGLLRWFTASMADEGKLHEQKLKDHFIVVGMNELGREIVLQLHDLKQKVIAIDVDATKLALLPCKILAGNVDYLATLEDANFRHAKMIVTALRIEDTNNTLAYRCQQEAIPIVVHGFDRSVLPELRRMGVTHILDSKSAWLRAACQRLRDSGVPVS